jgi:hypothetical protein
MWLVPGVNPKPTPMKIFNRKLGTYRLNSFFQLEWKKPERKQAGTAISTPTLGEYKHRIGIIWKKSKTKVNELHICDRKPS